MICEKCGKEMQEVQGGVGCFDCGIYMPNMEKLLEQLDQVEVTISQDTLKSLEICPLVFYNTLQKNIYKSGEDDRLNDSLTKKMQKLLIQKS